MFLSKRLKNITKYFALLLIVSSIVLILGFLEINVEFFSDIHNFLSQRELENRTIGYAYITISVAILSLGTISFTILIGRIQHLANELSSQSFDDRILKDRRTDLTYISLMLIATLLIIIYLVADFHKYPMMYLSFLVISVVAIIGLVYILFFSLMKDLSIYNILNNSYSILNDTMKEYKKLIIKNGVINDKYRRFNDDTYFIIIFLYDKFYSWKISKIEKKVSMVGDFYKKQNHLFASELTYIIRNASLRRDYQLERYALRFTTMLIKHHVTSFRINYPYNLKIFDETRGLNWSIWDSERFIISYLLPIYEIPKQYYSMQNGIETSNNEFENLILQVKDFSYVDGTLYLEILIVIFIQYAKHIIRQIKEKSDLAYQDYVRSINRIIFRSNTFGFYKLGEEISRRNVTIAKEAFASIKSINLMELFIVQTILVIKLFKIDVTEESFYSYELEEDLREDIIEIHLNNVFEILKISIEKDNTEKIRDVYEYEYSNWFEKLSEVVVKGISDIAKEYYELGLEDTDYAWELQRILKNIIQGFRNNSELIAIASEKDVRVIKYYNDLIQNLIRTVNNFVSSYFNNVTDKGGIEIELFDSYIDLYLDCLELYVLIVVEECVPFNKIDRSIILDMNKDSKYNICSNFIESFDKNITQFYSEALIPKHKKILADSIRTDFFNCIRYTDVFK